MRKRRVTLARVTCAALALFLGAKEARAVVIATIVPSAPAVSVGDSFSVEIRSSLSDSVVGFGLDLAYDPSLLQLVDAPQIGPLWLPVAALDGDGLAGLAAPPGVSGSDVLLARVDFKALAPGSASLSLGVTPGDLAEGFALYPVGFDSSVQLGGASIVVPEPAAAPLWGVLGALLLAARRLTRR
jgi:hypothetical protein